MLDNFLTSCTMDILLDDVAANCDCFRLTMIVMRRTQSQVAPITVRVAAT